MPTNHLDSQYHSLTPLLEELITHLQKHHRIKMVAWVKKLDLPINNQTWKENRNLHARVIIKMIQANRLFPPFDKNPPEGPLPRLNVNDLPYPLKNAFITKSRSTSALKNLSQRSLHKKQNLKPNQLKSFNQTQDTKKPNNGMVSHRSSWNKLNELNESGFREAENRQTYQPTPLHHQTSVNRLQAKSNYQQCLKISQQLQDSKMMHLLRRTLKFLVKNNDLLCDQPQYGSIVEAMITMGEEKSGNLREGNPEGGVAESRMRYKRGSQQRLEKRSVESLQFLEYLNECKPKFN